MPGYPEIPTPARHDPLVIHSGDHTTAYTVFPLAPPPPHGALDPYHLPPGMQLVPGPDGRPAYVMNPEPARPALSPVLVNVALGVAILLGIGAACWLIAAVLTALAALLQAAAMLLLVLIGGTVVLKALGTSNRNAGTHVEVHARGRARVNVNTRPRGRRR
ncbi:hypothetical protein [Streptomyces abikoensis]|uniref:Integral membrane protein n=1 Tax=Streptomyces abikoensis TaxID=97398 RepID=A0ABW7TD41_9ACTN